MKAVEGAVLIAGSVAIVVASGGMATGFAAEIAISFLLTGASLEASAIASALSSTPLVTQTVKSPASPMQFLFGASRINGTIIAVCSNGSNFKYSHMVIVFCGHQTEGIQQVWLNGQAVQFRNNAQGGYTLVSGAGTIGGYATSNILFDQNGNEYSFGGGVYCELYNGAPQSYQNGALVNGQASQYFIANGPNQVPNSGGTPETPYWSSTCTMDNQTYMYMRLNYNPKLWQGLPQSIRVDCYGCNTIYDPRSGTTGYTANAALCLAHFLCDPLYGLNYNINTDINIPALIAAANVCDEQITLAAGGTEPQYSTNGTFTTQDSPGNTIQALLQNMAGNLSYIGNQWYIYAGTYRGVSASINESQVIDKIDVQAQQKARDAFNAVRGTFNCPNDNSVFGSPNIFEVSQNNHFQAEYTTQSYPNFSFSTERGYASDPYLIADGQKLYKMMDFPFCHSFATCQRIAKQYLLKNRWGALTIKVKCNLSTLDIIPTDIVTFSYPRYGWVNKEFEVVSTNMGYDFEDGKAPVPYYELQMRETDPSIYEWTTQDELQMDYNNYPQWQNILQVAPPQSLLLESGSSTMVTTPAGVLIPTILASWTAPPDQFVTDGGKIVVQLQVAGSTSWNTVGIVDGATSSYTITGVSSGVTYNVQIYAVNVADVPTQAVAATASITVSTGTDVFSNGSTLSNMQQGALGVNKNVIPDPDFRFHYSYWSNPGTVMQILPGIGLNGANALLFSSAASGTFAQSGSTPFPVVAGQTYTFSGFIDATAVTAGNVFWSIYNTNITTEYVQLAGTPGTNARLSATWTVPAGVTEVVCLADCGGATITSGQNVLFCAPMLQQGTVMTSYLGNTGDDSTGYLVRGAHPPEYNNVITSTSEISGVTTISGGSGSPVTTIDQGATGANPNLIPDSNIQFGSTYWSLPNANWSIGNGLGYQGLNAIQVSSAQTGGPIWSESQPIPVTPGQEYVLSAYIDASFCSNILPGILVLEYAGGTSEIVELDASVGTKGRIYTTFTVPTGITEIILLLDTRGTTIASGEYLRFSAPMLQAGGVMTAYLPNVVDNITGYIKRGAHPPEYNAVIAASSQIVGTTTITGVTQSALEMQNLHDRVASTIGGYSATGLDNVVDGSTYKRVAYVGANNVFHVSTFFGEQGSVVSVPVNGSSILAYSTTSTSVTITWQEFYIYQPDGTIYTIPANSTGTTFSGLTASTVYYLSAYVTLSTLAMNIALNGTSGPSLQTQVTVYNGDGNVAVDVGFTISTPSSGTTSGTGTGGTGTGATCPEESQELETLERGYIPAREIEPGMHVRGWHGEWNTVHTKEIIPSYICSIDIAGETLKTDINHKWLVACDHSDCQDCWISSYDLRLSTPLRGDDGQIYLPTRIECTGRGNYVELLVDKHRMRMGKVIGHNFLTTT